MKQFELSFKSSWLYKYQDIKDVETNRNIVYVDHYQGVDLFRLTRTYMNKNGLEDIKAALDNGENEIALELINSLKEQSVVEDFCQVLVFRDLMLICIVTDRINNWSDFIRECKLEKVRYTNKELILHLTNNKFTENILNVTYDYKKSDSMINAINIYGSGIQNSIEFDNVIKDMERQILNVTFQPAKYNFLVTLNGSKLQVSKYTLNDEYLDFLIQFIYFTKEMVKNYDY
ncbi:hypothetical protein [Clostridium estertheticum]|uniref:Uncharacterized protein n=1 Tax=Clostridium estertheticum TaxID=238834 RepID=A0AA47EQM1_9CLOT|nr:hypothetical protein [Clostridium estertheticum]MBU3154025.1 hypothetical protein [Clostridium estertheticum]WAG62958.1 hypothetical protein LL038_12275 [Clostridium estertheticum]